MRYLSDSEIIDWNRRLENSPYMVRPKMHNRSGNVDIVFIQKVKNGIAGFDLVETADPHISMKYLFSVSTNRVNEFWDIFEKRKSVSLGTQTFYANKNESISFDTTILREKKETTHKIVEKEFTRYNMEFVGKLSKIIAYIMVIEDSIKFFEKIWAYNEDGSEVCLLKFPVGTICSKKSAKSEDYVVLDYDYAIIFNEYKISYKISYMNYSPNSSVIKYGDVEHASESELCFSRNERIDDILN